MFLGIKSKKEKEAERLQKEQEERQQLETQFSEAKEQLANSLFGIGYDNCNHKQLYEFDQAFRKRFPEMVQLLNKERIGQLAEVRNEFSRRQYHYGYDSCCYLRKDIINGCIYACNEYPDLIPYLKR